MEKDNNGLVDENGSLGNIREEGQSPTTSKSGKAYYDVFRSPGHPRPNEEPSTPPLGPNDVNQRIYVAVNAPVEDDEDQQQIETVNDNNHDNSLYGNRQSMRKQYD